MGNIEETKEKLKHSSFNFIGVGIMLIFILNILLLYFFYCLELEVIQNNKNIEKLRKEIVVNNRNFSNLYKEVKTINRNFTRAAEVEIEKDTELEEVYRHLDNEIAKNENNGIKQRRNILPEQETRVIEKFKNAIFNEQNIKEVAMINVSGTKVLLPINQKARNRNSKEFIKNMLSKLKTQYNFDDYKIEIIWNDGTVSSI